MRTTKYICPECGCRLVNVYRTTRNKRDITRYYCLWCRLRYSLKQARNLEAARRDDFWNVEKKLKQSNSFWDV